VSATSIGSLTTTGVEAVKSTPKEVLPVNSAAYRLVMTSLEFIAWSYFAKLFWDKLLGTLLNQMHW